MRFQLKWKNCKSAFEYRGRIPLFSNGGGRVELLLPTGRVLDCQKHFYFFKWCFLTIRYKQKLPNEIRYE